MRTFMIIVVALLSMMAFQADDSYARSSNHYRHGGPTWEGVQQYNYRYAVPTQDGINAYRYRHATPTREGLDAYKYRQAAPTREGLKSYEYRQVFPSCSKRRAVGLDAQPGVNCR